MVGEPFLQTVMMTILNENESVPLLLPQTGQSEVEGEVKSLDSVKNIDEDLSSRLLARDLRTGRLNVRMTVGVDHDGVEAERRSFGLMGVGLWDNSCRSWTATKETQSNQLSEAKRGAK